MMFVPGTVENVKQPSSDVLEAQLCTLLLNADRLSADEMLVSIVAKAAAPDILVTHLHQVARTLSGQSTTLAETLSDAGVSVEQLGDTAAAVHAVLAERLGQDDLKRELDTQCFRIHHPQTYTKVVSHLDYAAEQAWLAQVADTLVAQAQVPVVLCEHRVKSVPSAWAKSGGNLNKLLTLHDLYGVRLVVPSAQDCYTAVSALLSARTFDTFHYRDYVAKAKKSGYSSLHIVLDIDDRRVEVQVRTEQMHHDARFGPAAHWAYKSADMAEPSWLPSVLAGAQLPSKLRVFTPAGQVVVLDRGACVIDFAYMVHSDVGSSAVGASVNGQPVALSTVLSDGDTVAVRVGKRDGPNKDWLRIVVSSRVRTKIKRQLRELDPTNAQFASKPKPVSQPALPPVRPKLAPPTPDGASKAQVQVVGAAGLPYRFAQCCQPLSKPNSPLVARGLRDGVFNVHCADCVNVKTATNTVPAASSANSV